MKETLVNDDLKKRKEFGECVNTVKELRNHMRLQHSAGQIACNKCEKVFDQEWKLNAHLKKHRDIHVLFVKKLSILKIS